MRNVGRYGVLFGLAAAVSAVAAMPGAAQVSGRAASSSVQAGTYKVEPYHTQIEFSLSHFGFTEFSGFFSGASGSLTLDPRHVSVAKLDVSVPVDSVTTTVPKLSSELKNEQWFDAAHFPSATFVSSRITPTGKNGATIEGNLTLHGVTRPVTLHAHLVGAGVNPMDKSETIGFSATGTIKRSDFGVKQYVPMVGDDVHLQIAGAFTRAS